MNEVNEEYKEETKDDYIETQPIMEETKEEYKEESKEDIKPIKSNKPKWAYTEKEVTEEEEKHNEEELDDLLHFVDTLDYDKYMEDLELRTALMKVKDRIAELAEPKVRTGDDTIGVTQQKIDDLHNNNSDPTNNENEYDDDDVKSVVSILSEDKKISNIHSKQSLKAKVEQVKNNNQLESVEEEEEEYLGPRTVIVY